jgi:hypothetical protein
MWGKPAQPRAQTGFPSALSHLFLVFELQGLNVKSAWVLLMEARTR